MHILDTPHGLSPSTRRFPSPYIIVKREPETIDHETSFASDSVDQVVETSDGDECYLKMDDEFFSRGQVPAPNRYFKQKRSAHGKVAYVVFAGRNVGVFYNWTSASLSVSGVEFSSKVFKGYASYEAAHSAWDGFVSTGCLPADVAATLGTRTYPTPPITSVSPRASAPPTTPQRSRAYNQQTTSPLISHSSTPTPHTPPVSEPSSSRIHVQPIMSPSTPRTPTSTRSRSAAALDIAREEAFRADREDFWVVFTGTSPGVHQGREAGESAFGQLENPSFVRTSAREQANQIFVDGYMELLVVRYVI